MGEIRVRRNQPSSGFPVLGWYPGGCEENSWRIAIPSCEEFESLPLIDTNGAGVYHDFTALLWNLDGYERLPIHQVSQQVRWRTEQEDIEHWMKEEVVPRMKNPKRYWKEGSEGN